MIFECGSSWYVAEYLKNGLKAEVPLEATSLHLTDLLANHPDFLLVAIRRKARDRDVF